MYDLLTILLTAWIVLGAIGWEWGVVGSKLLAGPLVWAVWVLGYILIYIIFGIVYAVFFFTTDHDTSE